MGSKANYVLVGLFVLLFTAGTLGFAWWLASHGGQQEYDYYQVFMTESVAGLSTDASVKYRGVDVGTVAEMGLNPKNPEQVRLLLKIRRGTPIKTDTTATLKFYGVTGLAFVELQGHSENAPRLEPKGGEIPVIPSAPSTITRLDDALSTLATKSSRALDKIDRLLSEENLENVSVIVRDTRDLVHGLHQVTSAISEQMDRFRVLIDKGVEMEEDVSSAFDQVVTASLSVDQLARALEKTYVYLGDTADQFIDQSGELLQSLYADLDLLLQQLQVTVEQLRQHPADLLFSRSTAVPGPGEVQAP